MPWTSGGGSQGPWGGPPRGPRPPNLEDLLRGGQERVRQLFPGGFGGARGVFFVFLVIVAVWLASGFYTVGTDEQGVVLRFGAYNRTTVPGLHYHFPAPIERVLRPKVTLVNQIDIGFQRTGVRGERIQQVPEESLMLTGDENIVDVSFSVQWLIKDAKSYLFNIRAPEVTVKAAAESAMREIIGQTPVASTPVAVSAEGPEGGAVATQLQNPLAKGRGQIEQDTKALLQKILDSYGSGIEIVQVQLQKVYPPPAVVDAFLDVQRALADKQRLINESESYRNDIIPRARGQAQQIIQQAEAYKQQVIANAEGDAKRFTSVDEAYQRAKDVTLRRLYLETMEDVLKNTNKVVIDRNASSSGVVPYLPLPELKPRAAAPAEPATPPSTGQAPSVGAESGGAQPEGSKP